MKKYVEKINTPNLAQTKYINKMSLKARIDLSLINIVNAKKEHTRHRCFHSLDKDILEFEKLKFKNEPIVKEIEIKRDKKIKILVDKLKTIEPEIARSAKYKYKQSMELTHSASCKLMDHINRKHVLKPNLFLPKLKFPNENKVIKLNLPVISTNPKLDKLSQNKNKKLRCEYNYIHLNVNKVYENIAQEIDNYIQELESLR
jgi:hypothetical protein